MIRVGVSDVPVLLILGFFSAFVFQRRLRKRSPNWYAFLTMSFVSIFWINAIGANMGIISYWIFGVPVVVLDEIIGILYILSYPLWFRAAGEVVFLLFGRRPDQGGLLWVFRLTNRTESIDPSWQIETQNASESSDTER